MLNFKIEQIAIAPANVEQARKLLEEMGAIDWVEDTVVASGKVFGKKGENKADLNFNYDLIEGKEFEILNYKEGNNWVDTLGRGRNTVSHLGMHCSGKELIGWRKFFAERNIPVAQEVKTQSHTNPVIAGKRWYNYVIFDTKEILGVDLKFIVRIEKE